MAQQDDLPFSFDEVEKWNRDLEIGAEFNSIRKECNSYWSTEGVLQDVTSLLCSCWIIRRNNALKGYITLLADNFVATSALLPEENDTQSAVYPAIKIGVLASDRRAKGAGACLVRWALEYAATEIAPRIGARFITVNAVYDAVDNYDISGFYRQFGFDFVSPTETLPPLHRFRTLYLDILPFYEALR